MILNMPVHNGAITSTTSSQGQNEFSNFLKRKYCEDEIGHNQTTTASSNAYEENPSNHLINWKKRHIEHENDTNNYGINQTSYSSRPEEYQARDGDSQQQQQQQHIESSNSEQGTFNIIANSSFINDLFAYDANLIVPVPATSLSASDLTEDHSTFRAPSSATTICANTSSTQFEEDNNNGGDDNWQAADLLELDHRYNTSFNSEITHLNPTVSLKADHHHQQTSLVHSSSTNSPSPSSLNPQSQQPHPQETHFLLPQKPTKHLSSPASNSSFVSSSYPLLENLEQECDFEDKNLSWLLNFKFDEFPHLNPDLTAVNGTAASKTIKSLNNGGYSIVTSSSPSNGSPASLVSYGKPPLTANPVISNIVNGVALISERSKSPKNSQKTGKKFEELVMEVTSEMDGSDMVVAENVVIEESSHRAPKKPPFTYTELIEYALEDKGELTVSGIYQWISDRFPYYKSNDDRWKNSVRHNLSINPHFRKGHKAPQGAGHLWTISSGDSAENVLAWEHKKQRLDLFFKMESMNRERLQQHHQQQQQLQKQQQQLQQNGSAQHKHIGCQQDQCLYDEAAVAAAAIQQEMLQQSQNNNNNDANLQNQNSLQHHNNSIDSNGHVLHELPYNDLLTDEELRKTAGQILNGIHREVEVQSVNHHQIIGTYYDVLLDNDYLNPIHKDVVVNESGLRHSSSSTVSSHCHSSHSSSGAYYVTEIDPMELGIQMSTHAHHHPRQHIQDPSANVTEETDAVLFNDEFNLNYFTYSPTNDIVA